MTEQTMIERVARALCEAAGDHPDSRYPQPAQDPIFLPSGTVDWTLDWHKYVHATRAAIAAMRDPTEAMCAAVNDVPIEEVTDYDRFEGLRWTRNGNGLKRAFAAMIDAALAEA